MGVVGEPIVCRCEDSQREGRANRGAEHRGRGGHRAVVSAQGGPIPYSPSLHLLRSVNAYMGKGMQLVGSPMDGHRHHYQQPPTGDGGCSP